MRAKDVGKELALTVNEISSDEKRELFRAMIKYLDKKSKETLENEMGVII